MRFILCEVCGSAKHRILFEGWDRIFRIPGIFKIVKCLECGLIFINPQPEPHELEKYYPEKYYGSESVRFKEYSWLRRKALETYWGYPIRKSASKRKRLFQKLLLIPFRWRYRRSIPFVEGGRLLDIGCGNGTELYKLRMMGWETYGVELNQWASDRARSEGLLVFTGDLFEANFPDQFFDVVRMSFVLEHLPNPRETLVEIKRILKPQGRLYLSLQNTRSLNYWLFGERWFSLDIPRHLFSFSVETLRKLVFSLDLKIQALHFDSGTRTFLASLQYVIDEWNHRKPLAQGNLRIYQSHFLKYLFRPFCWFVDRIRLGDLIHLEIINKT